MPHLAKFILSEGRRYMDLIPMVDNLSPNKSGDEKGCTGWAYCAGTADKNLYMLYFERDCPVARLSGARAGAEYDAHWFDPRQGKWIDAGVLKADSRGAIELPEFPKGSRKSKADWALKLLFKDR